MQTDVTDCEPLLVGDTDDAVMTVWRHRHCHCLHHQTVITGSQKTAADRTTPCQARQTWLWCVLDSLRRLLLFLHRRITMQAAMWRRTRSFNLSGGGSLWQHIGSRGHSLKALSPSVGDDTNQHRGRMVRTTSNAAHDGMTTNFDADFWDIKMA